MSFWVKLRAVYRYTDIPPYRCTGKAKHAIPKNPIQESLRFGALAEALAKGVKCFFFMFIILDIKY